VTFNCRYSIDLMSLNLDFARQLLRNSEQGWTGVRKVGVTDFYRLQLFKLDQIQINLISFESPRRAQAIP